MEKIRRITKALIYIIFFIYGYHILGDSIDFYFEKKKDVYFPPSIEKDEIIEHGHKGKYERLIDSVKNDKRVAYNKSNYIDYSLIMAHRHNYVPANYDIFVALMSVFGEENTDSLTKELALYYLNRGAALGDSKCIKEMKRRHLPIEKHRKTNKYAKDISSYRRNFR